MVLPGMWRVPVVLIGCHARAGPAHPRLASCCFLLLPGRRKQDVGGRDFRREGRDNCLSHDRVPAFGSDVPKQRLIVAPRDAGGDARKRIPVIKKITNLRARQVFSLPAIAASHSVGRMGCLSMEGTSLLGADA
jgi:hypothetical protein